MHAHRELVTFERAIHKRPVLGIVRPQSDREMQFAGAEAALFEGDFVAIQPNRAGNLLAALGEVKKYLH